MPDHYETLGVSRQANAGEIRKAYMTIARERHPDRFSDPEEKRRAEDAFKLATAAFNTLSSDKLRQEYDAELARPRVTDPVEMAREEYAGALKRLEARDVDGALALLRAAIHHDPVQARYHALLGRALSRVSQGAREAVEAFEAALRLEPANAGHHVELARLLVGKGLAIRARKLVETALRIAPADRDVQRLAAELGLDPGGGPGEGGTGGILRRRP